MKKKYLLSCIVIFYWLISCQSVTNNAKIEVLTAEYSFKKQNEFEKGYSVFMVIKSTVTNSKIKHIVLNNRKFSNIQTYEMEQKTFFIDQFFPVESMRIQNFSAPEPDTRADGIIFEINGEEFYKTINFKLK